MQRSTKAQAQAQAQRQEAIQPAQSIALCQALLRVSIYHVTYLRGIFPDKHYKPVDMRNLDNMEVHMLLPKDPESERLVQWVEGGVAHALERRYLRKVFFGFSRDAAGKDLLEEYVFSFSYDQDGGVHMAAGGSSRAGKEFSTKDAPPGSKGPTLNAVKYQVCRLMRMLVELTNTLEQVPEERFLFMKLTYTDDTPEDYEPPMFAPAADGGVGCFSRMPFVMEVGRVDTRHIKVGLAVKTVLDNMEDGTGWGAQGAAVEDNSELFTEDPVTKAGATSAAASRRDTAEGASMGGGFSCVPRAAAKDAVDEVQQAPVSSPSLAAVENAEAALRALRVAPLDSEAGGIYDAPGSQRTVSVTLTGRKRQAAPLGSKDEPEAMLFPETQPSAVAGSRQRQEAHKASFVERPIHQDTKRQRKAAAQPKGAEQVVAAAGVRRSLRRR